MVPSSDQLQELVAKCLDGARCVSEIPDVECLRLPSLDEAQEAQVLAHCPDTIMELGKERTVEYNPGCKPIVLIGKDETRAGIWKDLPDEGVFLPNGRLVMLKLLWGAWEQFGESYVPALKEQLAKKANEHQWEMFTDRPEIALPDPMDPDSQVQCVKDVEYGKCVVTSAPLIAYGTAATPLHTHWEDRNFRVVWTRDMHQAYELHAQAVSHIENLRALKAREIESKRKYNEARKVQDELRQLVAKHCEDGFIPQNLRSRLNTLAYDLMCDFNAERYMRKAEQLKAQLVAADKDAEVKREEERKAQQIADARNIEIYGIAGNLLAMARTLAERAMESLDPDTAEEIFMEELTAPYGKDRRQDAIRKRFGNGGSTSVFYALSKAPNVNAVLEAAMTLVNEAKVKAAQKATQTNKPQTPADPSRFDMGRLFGGVAKEAKRRGGRKGKRR